MPSVFIPVPLFPNVPFLPGVPQLVRSALFQPATNVTLGSQQGSMLWAASQTEPSWGIFNKNNVKVIDPDSVFALDARSEYRLSDYNQQNGAFVSYNKVVVPKENVVRMTKGGSTSDRTAFLQSILAIEADTNLYNILTPEITYVGFNIERVEYQRRGALGTSFLEVDIFLRQIKEITAEYSTTAADTANAQNPPALPATNQGTVQPQSPVSQSVQSIADNAISSAPL